MSDYICPNCRKIKLSDRHQCPSQWLCKHDWDTDSFDNQRSRYANTPEAAAEDFAHDWFCDGSSLRELTIHVINYSNPDKLYVVEVEPEMILETRGRVLEEHPYTPEGEEEIPEEE